MTNNWHTATLLDSFPVAEDIKGLKFSIENREPHIPGQHYAIRLTSPEGYVAERDYSVANIPSEDSVVELGVELLPDGEVSPFLHNMKKGDQIEMKGPLGGHFIWDRTMEGPIVLIAGGSGLVPLMCMLRQHMHYLSEEKQRQVVLLGSFKTEKHIMYYEELLALPKSDPNIKLFLTLTREQPTHWNGFTRRVDKQMITETVIPLLSQMPLAYICGPTLFVESVADTLVEMGMHSHQIKTERFG